MFMRRGRKRSGTLVEADAGSRLDHHGAPFSGCFVVAPPGDPHAASVSEIAGNGGLPTTAAASLAALRVDRRFIAAPRPLILIVDGPATPLDVSAAVAFVREQNGRGTTICVAETIAPDAYKQLVRTGSADWVAPRDCAEELRILIERSTASPGLGRPAAIVGFLPSKGGAGNTSLVVEVAAHLATRRKRDRSRLAVVDLNIQGGTIADALDLEPRFDLAGVVAKPERLDEHLVDIFASRHAKGFDVFASPASRLDLDAVRPEIVFALIDAIASRYGVLLLDLPAYWTPWTDDLLRGSDAVVACGRESVPELRRLGLVLEHLNALPIPAAKTVAVVSAVETGILGKVSRRAVVEKALAGRRVVFVRRDCENARMALDVGRPLADCAPHSGIARDMRSLARWVEATVDAPAKAGRVSAPASAAA